MPKNQNKINNSAIALFLMALFGIIGGTVMLIENKAILGRHRDLSLNVVDGWIILFVGLVFLVVAYFSLSPFGQIRQFFENFGKKKKKSLKTAGNKGIGTSHRQCLCSTLGLT